MKTNKKLKGKVLWQKELSERIPQLQRWDNEELDILIDYVDRNILANPEVDPIIELLNSYKCSVDELRQAISTQLTCTGWSFLDSALHHCAAFMATGSAPMPEYATKAIQIFSEKIEIIKAEPNYLWNKDIRRFESAIAFLSRYENKEK
jgi:hypothetical protein